MDQAPIYQAAPADSQRSADQVGSGSRGLWRVRTSFATTRKPGELGVFFWEGDFSCKKKILLFLIIFWGDFFVWRKIKFMPLSFCLGEFCKGCAGDECP